MSNIVFLVRAYNEGSRIVEVIRSILQAGYTHVCVVNDGSQDNTVDLLLAHFPQSLHLISHPINRGAGAALETGFEYIRQNATVYNWESVVTFDGDGQHDIADMKEFVSYRGSHPDAKVVFGSRSLDPSRSNVPMIRKGVLFGGRIFTYLFSGVWLSDAHNGYRMIDLEVIRRVHLRTDGMEYASELIDQIHACKYQIHEVSVSISYDEYTLGKGQRFGGALRIVSRMLFHKFLR